MTSKASKKKSRANYLARCANMGWDFKNEVLSVKMPELFGETVKPLAIGIHKQMKLHFPDIPTNVIKGFLNQWVKTEQYKESVLKFTDRFNLDGTVSGAVTTEQKHEAIHFLQVHRFRTGTIKRSKEDDESVKRMWNFRDEVMRGEFSDVFGKERKPLSVNIVNQILTKYPELERKHVEMFITEWRNTLAYLTSVSESENVFNLDGTVYGVLPSTVRQKASLKVMKINEQNKKRGMRQTQKAS